MIYDEGRQLAVLHKKGSPCVLTDASDLNADMITDYSSMELEYQKLWKGFFESIAIDAMKKSCPAKPESAETFPKRYCRVPIVLLHSFYIYFFKILLSRANCSKVNVSPRMLAPTPNSSKAFAISSLDT